MDKFFKYLQQIVDKVFLEIIFFFQMLHLQRSAIRGPEADNNGAKISYFRNLTEACPIDPED